MRRCGPDLYGSEDRDQWRDLVNTVRKLRFHKRLGISCLVERLLASQVGFCSMELVIRYITFKVKVKLSLWLTKHHAMKAYWRSGGIAPRILDLGTRWRRVVSFTPRPLYPQGKSPWYPLDRRLGGPQSRSGRGGEEKNPQPPPGIEP
jgi:hypothetical protein